MTAWTFCVLRMCRHRYQCLLSYGRPIVFTIYVPDNGAGNVPRPSTLQNHIFLMNPRGHSEPVFVLCSPRNLGGLGHRENDHA